MFELDESPEVVVIEAKCSSWRRAVAGSSPQFVGYTMSLMLWSGVLALLVFVATQPTAPGPIALFFGVLIVAAFFGVSALGLVQLRHGAFRCECFPDRFLYLDQRPFALGAGRTIDTRKHQVTELRRTRRGIVVGTDKQLVWGYQLTREVRLGTFLTPEELDVLEGRMRGSIAVATGPGSTT